MSRIKATDKFEHVNLPHFYEYVRVDNTDTFGPSYTFQNAKGDYFTLYVWKGGEYRFLDDNFPGQRRAFNSKIPIRTFAEFEMDLRRMKIEIPKRRIP